MSSGEAVQERIDKVLQASIEPSYLSEIARKLDEAFPDETWNVETVIQAASVLSNDGRVETYDVDYSGTGGQKVGSPHSTTGSDDEEGSKEWETYTIIHWQDGNIDSIDDEILEFVEPAVTVEQKAAVIESVSGAGNDISREAEKIMQDEMSRQFRNYSILELPGYNDPGLDFVVIDDSKRNFGLAIEVSTRYENPIDKPYLDSKQDKAHTRDLDLVILAPEFTDALLSQFEKVTDERWHREAEGEITHLHQVPIDKPGVYRPFATEPVDLGEDNEEGYPVIVPDSERVREKLKDTGHVSDNYPVVGSDRQGFRDMLDGVGREFNVVRESSYRTQLRESMEPLLHEFSKPYRIEQFLIDTYWDEGMSTTEIGQMVGVSGRTIRNWLSDQHWDIITRGSGTPFSESTLQIWIDMYNENGPFPREMTGYEIQYLYNMHPFFTIDDWREWYEENDEEGRAEIMSNRMGADDVISYTILLGSEERLSPSYDFIIEQLRSAGVDIREGFFGETGVVYPTELALRYMINREAERFDVDDEPDQRDVTTMRSSLEVDLAEWLSRNEIPFGHEPFAIPSPFVDPGDSRTIDEIISEAPRDEVENMWRRIHNKHQLGDVDDKSPEETLGLVQRSFIVPDFATYPGTELEQKSDDWEGWMDYKNIIEVSGAYGTPPPTDFSSWYRFNSVAQKELAYKFLGVWDKVTFVLTDDEDIPSEVRSDSHYVIINPVQGDSGMGRLSRVITT